MTLGELKEMIDEAVYDYGEEMEVVIKPIHSSYVESINSDVNKAEVYSFIDDDFEAVIIRCGHQVGGV